MLALLAKLQVGKTNTITLGLWEKPELDVSYLYWNAILALQMDGAQHFMLEAPKK